MTITPEDFAAKLSQSFDTMDPDQFEECSEYVTSSSTFVEAGILTTDAGFVLRMADGSEFQQVLINGNTVGSVRRSAKAAGWGRINGGDYCPSCMASIGDQQPEDQP